MGEGVLKYWLLAVRPKTLTIAVVPVLVGTTLGWADAGTLAVSIMGAALIAAVLIQCGTNLHNDAADFERGTDDPATRIGPPRVTAQGWLPASAVRAVAKLSFANAFLIGCYLVWIGGWPILAIGLISIAAGLAYTSGPRPIAYTALGEVFVWLFFGLIAVAGSYYLQTGGLTANALAAGAMIGMPAAAVLVVNNYRDLDNDKRVGKNTLAVKLGRRVSRFEYALLMLLPFILLPLVQKAVIGDYWWVLPWLVLPWALVLIRRFWSEPPSPAFNQILAATARFQFVFGLLLCSSFLADPTFLNGV
jgi:1,4-dihydroxy-2-naphthoate octaprenyltransferase